MFQNDHRAKANVTLKLTVALCGGLVMGFKQFSKVFLKSRLV